MKRTTLHIYVDHRATARRPLPATKVRDGSAQRIKRDRSAFGFVKPPADMSEKRKKEHAQCISCRKLVPENYLNEGIEEADKKFKGDRCIELGSTEEIGPWQSCDMYSLWATKGPDYAANPEVIRNHANELRKGIPGSYTKKTAGWVPRHVQCLRCDESRNQVTWCQFFDTMTRAAPEENDFDPNIEYHSCCNAQVPK